jgi:hypothetical protein
LVPTAPVHERRHRRHEWLSPTARYNIRVISLSVGHSVMEPSATDPLCQQ